MQGGDEDSRQSFASNNDEIAAPLPPPPTGTGMKITLAKPISFSSPSGQQGKRKKVDLREVFNPDEDDSSTQVKKRKLVPLGAFFYLSFVPGLTFKPFSDYNEDKKAKKESDRKAEESLKSQEEKKKHIKSLIEKIPTEKDALFAYQLDWSAIDNGLMERKIRPWINKKIIEYIGEPEPTLVDFICSKVLAGSQPQIILQDVQMVIVIRNSFFYNYSTQFF